MAIKSDKAHNKTDERAFIIITSETSISQSIPVSKYTKWPTSHMLYYVSVP